MSVDIIDDYLNLFHLDRRSSVRELEIAYDVITKDLDEGEIFVYKRAFEYLMIEFYGVVEKENIPEDNELEDDILGILEDTPQEIIDSVEWCEENIMGEPISDKVKVLWTTQSVNLPMLAQNLLTNCKNIFGFKIWTENDICNILKQSCLNPIEYHTLCFDISSRTTKPKEVKSFVKSLKKLFKIENISIQRFITSENEVGVIGYVIAERKTCLHILNLIRHKCEQYDYCLNVSTTIKQ